MSSFSIIIPAYNYADKLSRAVESAMQQTGASFEVIVIDDGSTDHTPAVLADLEDRFPQGLRCIRQDNAGLSAVRNRGVKEAAYDWLIFLDADDELCPKALSKFESTIDKAPKAALIIGGTESVKTNHDRKQTKVQASPNRRDNFRRFLWKDLTISNGACAMQRRLFDKITYVDELKHTEDIPVFAAVLANHDIATTNSVVARIHHHGDSMRHDVDAALNVGMGLVDRIFDDSLLPDWAMDYYQPYRGKRALSLLKIAYRHQRSDLVRHFYRIGLKASPRRALKLSYLRRFIVSCFR